MKTNLQLLKRFNLSWFPNNFGITMIFVFRKLATDRELWSNTSCESPVCFIMLLWLAPDRIGAGPWAATVCSLEWLYIFARLMCLLNPRLRLLSPQESCSELSWNHQWKRLCNMLWFCHAYHYVQVITNSPHSLHTVSEGLMRTISDAVQLLTWI